MNKKILLGSLMAVAVIMLASCTNVMGADVNKKCWEVEEKQTETTLSVGNVKELLENIEEKLDISNSEEPQPAFIFIPLRLALAFIGFWSGISAGLSVPQAIVFAVVMFII